ncbi:hypothetical protein D3C87_1550460 [compost metagenome]
MTYRPPSSQSALPQQPCLLHLEDWIQGKHSCWRRYNVSRELYPQQHQSPSLPFSHQLFARPTLGRSSCDQKEQSLPPDQKRQDFLRHKKAHLVSTRIPDFLSSLSEEYLHDLKPFEIREYFVHKLRLDPKQSRCNSGMREPRD